MHGSQANVCRIRLRPCHSLEFFAIIVNVAPFGVDYWCAVLIHGQPVPIGRLHGPWCTREEYGSYTDVRPNKPEERRQRFFHRGIRWTKECRFYGAPVLFARNIFHSRPKPGDFPIVRILCA
jgi:hypothetical protein